MSVTIVLSEAAANELRAALGVATAPPNTPAEVVAPANEEPTRRFRLAAEKPLIVMPKFGGTRIVDIVIEAGRTKPLRVTAAEYGTGPIMRHWELRDAGGVVLASGLNQTIGLTLGLTPPVLTPLGLIGDGIYVRAGQTYSLFLFASSPDGDMFAERTV